MSNPGLLQELPDIPSLLFEGDGEQACPADGAVGRLDSMTDLALDDGRPPRLRPLSLSRVGGLNPGPSLDRGFEELRELRPILSRRPASSVAKAVSWLRSCSISCCWASKKTLTAAGIASHPASEIPPGIRLPSRVRQG